MSTFVERTLTCPDCGAVEERMVAESLHGPRVPEVVEAIRSRSFQHFTCGSCESIYKSEGPFVYLDFDVGFWVMVFPSAWENAWRALEAQTYQTFRTNMYDYAPRIARRMAEGVTVRTVFGLDALTEKLLCSENGLDDRVLECWKLDLLRNNNANLTFETSRRPRLTGVSAFSVAVEVPSGAADTPPSTWNVLRETLDRLERRRSDWSELIETFGEGSYVDLGRIMIPGNDPVTLSHDTPGKIHQVGYGG